MGYYYNEERWTMFLDMWSPINEPFTSVSASDQILNSKSKEERRRAGFVAPAAKEQPPWSGFTFRQPAEGGSQH